MAQFLIVSLLGKLQKSPLLGLSIVCIGNTAHDIPCFYHQIMYFITLAICLLVAMATLIILMKEEVHQVGFLLTGILWHPAHNNNTINVNNKYVACIILFTNNDKKKLYYHFAGCIFVFLLFVLLSIVRIVIF